MRTAALLLALLSAAACAPLTGPAPFAGSTDPALLTGEPWMLTGVADPSGTVSAPRAKLTLRFEANGRAGGAAGPNSYGGVYRATPEGAIALDSVVTTLIGGPEAERAGEYLARLMGARSYSATPVELRVHGPDGSFLHFRRQPRP